MRDKKLEIKKNKACKNIYMLRNLDLWNEIESEANGCVEFRINLLHYDNKQHKFSYSRKLFCRGIL